MWWLALALIPFLLYAAFVWYMAIKNARRIRKDMQVSGQTSSHCLKWAASDVKKGISDE